MTLSPGTRLGPYEIVAPLGAGGMGEVYRARDSKLDRDVALKILPESFARDPDRVTRFEREAKTLAALNHAHIAQIYGRWPVSDDDADDRHVADVTDVDRQLAAIAASLPLACPVDDFAPQG